MASEPVVIMCISAAKAVATVAGALPGKCSVCGDAVWVAPSSIRLMRKDDAKIVCLDCGIPMAAQEGGEIAVPTADMREELHAAGVTPAQIAAAVHAFTNGHRSDQPTWKKA